MAGTARKIIVGVLMSIGAIVITAVIALGILLFRDNAPAGSMQTMEMTGYTTRFGTLWVWSSGISFDRSPKQYKINGFKHIKPAVEKLLSENGHFLRIFTDPQQTAGVTLSSNQDGTRHLDFFPDRTTNAAQETKIRSFFSAMNISPEIDEVEGPNRHLSYPFKGNAGELADTVKRILEEVYGLSETDGLTIEHV